MKDTEGSELESRQEEEAKERVMSEQDTAIQMATKSLDVNLEDKARKLLTP